MEKYDYDFLKNNGFTFSLERLPQTMFRVVACDVPAISIPAPVGGFPGATQYFSGTNEEFDELSMSFLVDDDLKNYEEIYRWITQQKFAVRKKEFTPKNEVESFLYSDGTLVTMNNASNPNRVFSFKNLFPVSLGNLHFDTSVTEPQPVTCEVNFRYSYIELKAIDYIKNN